jgi:hypothetical protein
MPLVQTLPSLLNSILKPPGSSGFSPWDGPSQMGTAAARLCKPQKHHHQKRRAHGEQLALFQTRTAGQTTVLLGSILKQPAEVSLVRSPVDFGSRLKSEYSANDERSASHGNSRLRARNCIENIGAGPLPFLEMFRSDRPASTTSAAGWTGSSRCRPTTW